MKLLDENPACQAVDAAIACLPAEVRGQGIEPGLTQYDAHTGVVALYQAGGRLLAKVDSHGHVELGTPAYSLKAAAEERATKAAQAATRSEDAAVAARVRQSEDAILKAVARAIAAQFGALEEKLVAIEQKAAAINTVLTEKGLDLEVYDAVRSLAEKVESLTAGLSDVRAKSFNYRGYWRQGTVAKRGDAFTEGGTCWYANRDTETKPNSKDVDTWTIIANKGRDAR